MDAVIIITAFSEKDVFLLHYNLLPLMRMMCGCCDKR